jgi:HlyD family secretion protein
VLVDEGDKVTKGQLLARMDTRTLEAQRNQAEAEVLRARENLAAAQANVQLRQSEQLLASRSSSARRTCSSTVSSAPDHRSTAGAQTPATLR